MNRKSRLIFPFIVIIAVGILSYVLHRRELNPSLDLNNLRSSDITYIKIYDRGILGNDSLYIKDKDKLTVLSNLIISSTKIDFDSINTKANQGLCMITLKLRTEETRTFEMVNTSFSGGILSSGHYYYRNDSLLNVLSGMLDSAHIIRKDPKQG